MAGILRWLKSAAGNVFDPKRDQRIAGQATQMWQLIVRDKTAFNYEAACAELGVEVQDISVVRSRVYANALAKAWENGEINAKERRSLNMISALLHLPPEEKRALEWDACARIFRAALTDAFADGHISPEERDALSKIAAGFGQTTGSLMRHAFAAEGSAFLSGLLEILSLRGRFGRAEWTSMIRTAEDLGLTEADLRTAVAPQAHDVIERCLAYAKADGIVCQAESDNLAWLMDTLGVDALMRGYVDQEVRAVNELANIRAGNLPTVSADGLQLKAGEIVHHFGRGRYERTRYRKSGEHVERHIGSLAVTDSRLIFVSETAGVELNHRRVLSVTPGRTFADVQSGGKGTGCYHFTTEAEKAVLIYQTAIGRANQTLVARVEGSATRHIPRDVRQRVWQTYGGKCAECGDSSYLEYDHIIPHARGGSNDEQNVQLLCRRCNLRKSDNI